MTITMPVLPPPRISSIPHCPKCGNDLSLTFRDPDENAASLAAAQRLINDLQAQVRLLNDKATAAVDRWADYEDELSKLRRDLDASAARGRQDSAATTLTTATPRTPTVNTPSPPRRSNNNNPNAAASPGVSGFATAATHRISALLSRKSTPNLKAVPGHGQSQSTSGLLPTPPPSGGGGHATSYSTSSLFPPKSPLSYDPSSSSPPPSTEDLLQALTREQSLRLAAEGKLNETSREVEELSVTLFEQANEMVATERKAKARLEERVGELEKRDKEKGKRLQRLESAMGRIERARNLLQEEIAVQGK